MNKIKLVVAVLLAIALSGCLFGCAPITTVATDKVAAVADQALADSELIMCRGITVGAWVRRYGNKPELAGAWRTICGEAITQVPK